MTTDFNLSKNRVSYNDTLKCYFEADVKEFIRLLKEKMHLHASKHMFNRWVVGYYELLNIINKLAGESLI